MDRTLKTNFSSYQYSLSIIIIKYFVFRLQGFFIFISIFKMVWQITVVEELIQVRRT